MPEAGANRARAASPSADGALFAVAVVGIGSLILGIVAFRSPTSSVSTAEIPYQQRGTFAYRAAAPRTVYAKGRLDTGDPVYDALVPKFTVGMDYEFLTSEPAQAQGTIALTLEVSEPNGWSRRLPLQEETPFEGAQATAAGTVDLRAVRQMIALLERATGVDRDAYWVDVIPDVRLAGEVDGHPFEASFQPRLLFALDDHQLYLRAGESLDAPDTDPTRPVVEGAVPYMTAGPASLTILGLVIPVASARVFAMGGLLFSAAAAAAILLPVYRARRAGRAARILSEYASILVSVSEPLPATRQGVIEVQDFDDLALLAERTGRTILHAAVDSDHHFFLQDGEATYHARLADSPGSDEA